MQYIVDLAKKAHDYAKAPGQLPDGLNVFQLLTTLAEEINRLDPRDFLPSERLNFVNVRIHFRGYTNGGGLNEPATARIRSHLDALTAVMAAYSPGHDQTLRTFAFVSDAALRTIIARDYSELKLRVFASGAWKSTVVLAGSILEAILYDQLTQPAIQPRALASSRAPKDRSGTVLDLNAGDWKLVSLIEVATDLSILPAGRAKAIDQVLRDYRNYVHPKKEIRTGHPCTEAEALMAVGSLEAVCNELE